MRRPCVTRIRQPPGVSVGEGGVLWVLGVSVEGGWGSVLWVWWESEGVCCGCEGVSVEGGWESVL